MSYMNSIQTLKDVYKITGKGTALYSPKLNDMMVIYHPHGEPSYIFSIDDNEAENAGRSYMYEDYNLLNLIRENGYEFFDEIGDQPEPKKAKV